MVGRPSPCPSVRHAIAVLVLAASGSAGCQFNPSGQPSGDDGGPPPEPDARIVDARESDGREPDARPDARPVDAAAPPDAPELPPDGELVSHDLLTRYFIDEANSGSDVNELRDAADDPLDLTINYDGGGTFVEESNNRGLRWNTLTEDGDGRASASANGKIRQALDGSTRATIEVVVDIDQFGVDGARISHIGEGDDRGEFSLRLEQPMSLRFVMSNDEDQQNVWALALIGRQRTVLHLVLDTSQSNPAERVRLYVDGTAQANSGIDAPAQNEAINIQSTAPAYVLGNTEEGGRGIAGTIFYAAMYSTALSPDEVAHNADTLLDNDDTPAN